MKRHDPALIEALRVKAAELRLSPGDAVDFQVAFLDVYERCGEIRDAIEATSVTDGRNQSHVFEEMDSLSYLLPKHLETLKRLTEIE